MLASSGPHRRELVQRRVLRQRGRSRRFHSSTKPAAFPTLSTARFKTTRCRTSPTWHPPLHHL